MQLIYHSRLFYFIIRFERSADNGKAHNTPPMLSPHRAPRCARGGGRGHPGREARRARGGRPRPLLLPLLVSPGRPLPSPLASSRRGSARRLPPAPRRLEAAARAALVAGRAAAAHGVGQGAQARAPADGGGRARRGRATGPALEAVTPPGSVCSTTVVEFHG